MILAFVALFSPFLANNQPLYMEFKGEGFYPAFNTLFNESASEEFIEESTGVTISFRYQDIDWRRAEIENAWWPLITYSPGNQDKYNSDYAHPSKSQRFRNKVGKMVELDSRFRHVLGTDKLGRDVASGLIHGTKISLMVGVVSMSIAVIIGLFLGALAGYFGDFGVQLTRLQFWLGWFGVILGYFYGF